ncbi:MAG TPA: hypothetical protein DCZ62_07870 [Ruminococcus sp.]|nr:hypothetical protein [Ruminococcus sp.]
MKKKFLIITAAALAVSMTMAGAISAFASEEEPTTVEVVAEEAAPSIDEATAVSAVLAKAGSQFVYVNSEWIVAENVSFWQIGVKDGSSENSPVIVYDYFDDGTVMQVTKLADLKQIAGTWTYETLDALGQGTNNGTVVIKEDNSFTYTDLAGKTISGAVKAEHIIIAGDDYVSVTLTADGFSFQGEVLYDGNISIGAGATAQLVPGVSEAPPATAPVTEAAAKETKTTAAETKAPDKNSSPKTGVAFPALPIAGAAAAAAVAAFVLRKKED